jgi:hypothetical protein
MKYLQFIMLGMTLLVSPILASIVLLGLSLFYFQKHDWGEGFFEDRWGALGSISFLLGILVYVVLVYRLA